MTSRALQIKTVVNQRYVHELCGILTFGATAGQHKCMEAAADTQPIDRRSKTVRSKLANGSKLLPLTDGRSATARRFRDLIEDIMSDLGGHATLSEAQRQLVRRASMLSAESERMEAMWARGEAEFDLNQYCTMANNLRRILETIGLQRTVKDVSPSAVVAHFRRPQHRPVPGGRSP
jgi:hypothetical protein